MEQSWLAATILAWLFACGIVDGCINISHSLSPSLLSCRFSLTGNFFTYYEGGGLGPSRWEFLELDGNQCGGTDGQSGYGQSPVTITSDVRLNTATGGVCETDMSAYDFTNDGDCTYADLDYTISNNGVKIAPMANSTCTLGRMDIPHLNNPFKALQFHIHTYSEHRIMSDPASTDLGGYFPAELHVVHQEEHPDMTKASFAVFGTMISVHPNDTAHMHFEYYLKGWEAAAAKTADKCSSEGRSTLEQDPIQKLETCPATGAWNDRPKADISWPIEAINLYKDLPNDQNFGTYTYKGGLTTPGCTEVVNWNLLDQPMMISQDQLDRLERLIVCFVGADTCTHDTVADKRGSTSRPPQPLEGRKVTHRCPGGNPNKVVVDVGQAPPTTSPFTKPAPAPEPSNTNDSPKCTKSLYTECSDDKRYNPRFSPNLKANANAWYDFEGYWVGELTAYDNNGDKLLEVFASKDFKNTMPYPRERVYLFINRTVSETRFYETKYLVYSPADTRVADEETGEFCSYNVPANASNVLGEGTCGQTGYVAVGERFGTATFEKDGVAKIFSSTGRYDGGTGEVIPIDADTLYAVVSSETYEYSETESFSNQDKTRISGSGQYFIKSNLPPYSENPLAESYTYEVNQVSRDSFITQLEGAYNTNNVPNKVGPIVNGYCAVVEGCPTLDDFSANDPNDNSSPYDDDSTVKGGWIAFFVLLIVAVIVALGCWWHHWRFSKQADRYKHQFARRIAATIEVEGGHDKLTPDDLEKEFKNMDKDEDGVLSKAELKEFMDGKMSDRDFEAMFAAIDLDHNGTVDFAEFCAFMAQIGAVYDEEEMQEHGEKKLTADQSTKDLA